jgi:two-component system, cell cycle response regulator DivK
MTTYHVLIVDDTELNRKVLKTVLNANGFETSEAVDGEEALKKASSELPDLILMDVQLPVIDGYEVTRLLRAEPRTQHLKIIAVTAHAMVGESERARAAGCDGYISKPVNTRTLVDEIRVYLQ